MTGVTTEAVRFAGTGGHRLAGKLDLPPGEVRAYAVFAHCFTCSKDFFTAARVSHALAERGIAVLRLDFTGLGESEGERPYGDFDTSVADLLSAAAHLRAEHRAPSLLVGHSFGGATTLAAAALMPEVRAVATIAAPSHPAHVTGLFGRAAREIEERGEGQVVLAGRTFTFGKEFLDTLADQPQRRRIGALGRALLVLHSPEDRQVAIAEATEIFRSAAHPKSFVALDGADHFLGDPADARYAAEVIAAWASRYL
ncbi:alpha/beta hydrolase family protein [Streptomyces mauvecolor]